MNWKSFVKLRLWVVLAALLVAGGCGSSDGGEEQVWLFSSFRGEREGLYLAFSKDLYNWHEIASPHLKPQIGDNIMRDPFIQLGPDGIFHMIWTSGWGRRDIGYASTPDLVNWSEQRLLPVMESKPRAKNCWAPKLFYDKASQQWMIAWSTWLDDGTFPPPELPYTPKQQRIWYATTKDFKTISEPKVLFDPGYCCIDAYLLEDGDECLIFFKDERYSKNSAPFTPAHQNIRMARGPSLYGPFGSVSEPITGKGPGKWNNEGPCAIRLGDERYVFYDHHSGDTYFGAVVSKDLKNWTDVSDKMSIPKGLKHGSIIRAPRRIIDALIALKEGKEVGS